MKESARRNNKEPNWGRREKLPHKNCDGRELFCARSVQFGMKAKLSSIVLVGAAVAAVAGGIVYVTRLEMGARRLEARLARVESALYGKPVAAGVLTAVPSTNGKFTLVQKPQASLPEGQRGTLEQRVAKIEKQLAPHVEWLAPALSGPLEPQR
jgi:hypothetical protein